MGPRSIAPLNVRPMTSEPKDKPSFVCVDCGYDVFVVIDPDNKQGQTRCSTCAWVYYLNLPEEEKEKLRKFLEIK